MTIAYSQESFSAVWPEIGPLLEKHWAEVAFYPDIPLDPDVEMYQKIDEMGGMRVYTARDDGRLVGYNAFFMRPSIHYRGSLQASNDVIFLLPEYRKGGVGRGLIEYGDACLRNEGCQVVMHHVKVNHDWTPLLARMGYEKQDIICSKRLDKDH